MGRCRMWLCKCGWEELYKNKDGCRNPKGWEIAMSLSVVGQGLGVLLRKAAHQLAAGCLVTYRSPRGVILSEESMQ